MTKTCVLIIVDGLQPIYEDMMYMVQEMLEAKGYECRYLYHHIAQMEGLLKNDETTQCFFFGTKLTHPIVRIPDGSYLMDFDHAHWMHERFRPDIVERNHIITFSSHMIHDFRNMFGSHISIGLFRFGYTRYLDYGYQINPTYEYDVCFLGTVSDRRANVLDELQQKYRCFVHSHIEYTPGNATTKLGHIYRGQERAKLYQTSKIVLSIAFTDEYLQNTNASRIFPAVSTGAFVISERSLDEEQNVDADKICINVPLSQLGSTIAYYLHHHEERERLRQQFYEKVKTMKCDFPMPPSSSVNVE